MPGDHAREDIAFICQALEEGRNYATACGPDMVVWGVAVAVGYLGVYAFLRGWSPLRPGWVWGFCIGLPWLYSLRRILRRQANAASGGPMAVALRMLWLGSGITLTTLAVAALWSGDMPIGWFDAVVAGVLGAAMFASASLSNLPWLRWVASGWWVGEIAVYALRGRLAASPLSAALMLVLLAGPGLVLLLRRRVRSRA
jgi:hypothetical protein